MGLPNFMVLVSVEIWMRKQPTECQKLFNRYLKREMDEFIVSVSNALTMIPVLFRECRELRKLKFHIRNVIVILVTFTSI